MNQRTKQDEWLMKFIAQGHREHLEPLLRRHAGGLLTFLYRLLGDRHRSEELFQEVFLTVWTKRTQYEYPRPFKPWLYAIALNKCRAVFRTRGLPTVALKEDEGLTTSAASNPSPADTAIATESASLVAHAVALLPPQQRAVVVLRIWEDLPYADIAAIVNCTEATVRSHMHHGLATLREYLEPRLG